ncbi:MAG: M23 family metallopeptidase [Spirochaetaceae bacterium]|nr:M23 family metallopeptidase [Spirochaetaceae bacterium]
MNKTVILFFLVFLSTSLHSQHLFTERSGKRGEILNAYVYPSEGIISSRFSLIDSSGGIVSYTEGFLYVDEQISIEAALLGIPSDIAPGKYILKVFCETEAGSDQFTKPFFVSQRDYLSMDIHLDKKMSELRASDDPEKAEQSRQLWSVISSFDKEAQYFSDVLEVPVETYIESAFFGDRRNFIYSDGSRNKSLHYGSDFAAPVGEPVYSAGNGKVVLVENRIITGNTVIIEHLPGVYTLYYHMDSVSIEPGMVITKGTEIGKVGATGLVTGAHLHWELRVSKIPVDPLRYLEAPLIDKDIIMDIIKSIH